MKKQNKIQWILVIALLFASVIADAQDAAQQGSDSHAAEEAKTLIDHVRQGSKLPVTSAIGKAKMQSLEASANSCAGAGSSAKNFCIVSLNSTMQKAAATIGILMGAASTIATVNGACSKFAEATKIAQLALTAYNTMCGMAQQSCSSACSAYKAEIKEAVSVVGNSIELNAKNDAIMIETLGADATALSMKCEGYKLNLAAAGAGLTTILASSALNDSCKKETAAVDCAKDPMNASCAKALDCSKPENASNTSCICLKTPNTPGCSGYAGSNQNQVPQAVDDSNSELEIPALNTNVGGADTAAAIPPPSPTGNGVAPGGGGGGGGGGLSGGGTDGSSAPQKAKPGLNTNILSGYDGGGGGGGFRGGNGSSGSSDSGLNAYLPNGSKDPARQPATQLFGNGQVTGAGSKSNFEKVNERYGDLGWGR